MTLVFIKQERRTIARKFSYRFQARTWLVAHGYWIQDGNAYTNPYTGETATIESRRDI